MRVIRCKYYAGCVDEQQPRDIDLIEVIRVFCMTDLMLTRSISGTVGGHIDFVLSASYVDGSHEEVSYYGTDSELNEVVRFITIARSYGLTGGSSGWRVRSVINYFGLDFEIDVVRRYESYAVFEDFLTLAMIAHDEGLSLVAAAAAYA